MGAAFEYERYNAFQAMAAKAQWTITLTFGEQVENHAGMQKIGKLAKNGFTVEELAACAADLQAGGVAVELVRLDDPDVSGSEGAAAVLVVRGGLDALLGNAKTEPGADATPAGTAADALYAEQRALNVDKKAWMRGEVKNKNARWNLCFADEAQEPEYEYKKGRVVAYRDVPLTAAVRAALPRWLGPKAAQMLAEGNYYFGPKCYISFHGDSERKRVIAVRLGAPMPLWFQWYINRKPVGRRFENSLEGGDLYVMSEKATGHDWKKTRAPDGGDLPTLRHAAGTKRALGFKPPAVRPI